MITACVSAECSRFEVLEMKDISTIEPVLVRNVNLKLYKNIFVRPDN